MKICPNCQTRYTDDTLQFCLQDGAALVSSDDAQTSSPTVAFTDEQETVVKNRPAERINFDLQPPGETQNWQQQTSDPTNYQNAPPRKSNIALIVLTTALATLLIAGIGAAAWMYFGNKRETATDANVKNSFPENAAKNRNEASNVFTPPDPDEKPTVKPTPAPATPAPDFDPEQVKADISDTIDSWTAQAEARDLSRYMTNYSDTVDYYNKKGASIATVRADKQKAFSTFDVIEMDISNMRVTPDRSGDKATAVFDKEWHFENDERVSEGKVQTQLQLKKVGGDWKITSERDLKVYYTK